MVAGNPAANLSPVHWIVRRFKEPHVFRLQMIRHSLQFLMRYERQPDDQGIPRRRKHQPALYWAQCRKQIQQPCCVPKNGRHEARYTELASTEQIYIGFVVEEQIK